MNAHASRIVRLHESVRQTPHPSPDALRIGGVCHVHHLKTLGGHERDQVLERTGSET